MSCCWSWRTTFEWEFPHTGLALRVCRVSWTSSLGCTCGFAAFLGLHLLDVLLLCSRSRAYSAGASPSLDNDHAAETPRAQIPLVNTCRMDASFLIVRHSHRACGLAPRCSNDNNRSVVSCEPRYKIETPAATNFHAIVILLTHIEGKVIVSGKARSRPIRAEA